MIVQLLEHTQHPESAIADAAAECYGAITTPAANAKRLRQMLKRGHWSPLRFANATFRIADISRACSHQIVRTAHAGFLQRSQRYAVQTDPGRIVIPDSWKRHEGAYWSAMQAIDAMKSAYHALLLAGVPKEDARNILPEGSYTSLVMTGNFQMWHHWLGERTTLQAQWEIRAVALAIQGELARIAPTIFGAAEDASA